MSIIRIASVLLVLALSTSALADWRADAEALKQQIINLKDAPGELTADERLQQAIDLSYEQNLITSPEFATFLGDPRYQDRWSDNSLAAEQQDEADTRIFLDVMRSIPRAELSAANRLNYDLIVARLEEQIDGFQFGDQYLAISQLSGPQQDIAQLLAISRPVKPADYENMIARLNGIPLLIDNNIERLQKGLEAGVTPPQVTLRDVPDQIRAQIVDDPAQSSLLQAFANIPESMPAEQREKLQQQAYATYNDKVKPAFTKLLNFFENDYLPNTRESIGMSALPDGRAWYAHRASTFTTTDMSPQQIHDIGLSEVKRIRGEMEKVIADSGFEGSFADFLEFLRTDPQFYHASADDLLMEYRDIAKRADAELVKVFGKLPRLPYGVVPVPEYAEKSQTTAYYQPGSLEAGRPGNFFANTYALETRPRWEMEALTLHEAVPGHHFQIALAQELDELPWFRRLGGYTAYIEGWGLYSESLGEEMGFYQDPYSKFGQLTYEMWRAIRLVVDTGMHYLGWSRQQAIDYFKENAGKQEHDIIVEVDRYIVWPGQALAYKIGELKIKQLRAYATEQLGEAFDLRDFHDHLLGAGALPLDVLEQRMHEWVAGQQSS